MMKDSKIPYQFEEERTELHAAVEIQKEKLQIIVDIQMENLGWNKKTKELCMSKLSRKDPFEPISFKELEDFSDNLNRIQDIYSMADRLKIREGTAMALYFLDVCYCVTSGDLIVEMTPSIINNVEKCWKIVNNDDVTEFR